jgi:hypothetical protein
MDATTGYVLAALAVGLAIGLWREGAQAREQVRYLRQQLAHASGTPLPQEAPRRGLISVPGLR